MKMSIPLMNKFKEMVIPKPKVHALPQLTLSGKWLDEIGFTVGTLVAISYHDSCLILSTNSNADKTASDASVLVVESRQIRKHSRTTLIINGFLLKKYGFNIGDRVCLHIMPNQIQISKINRFTVAN